MVRSFRLAKKIIQKGGKMKKNILILIVLSLILFGCGSHSITQTYSDPNFGFEVGVLEGYSANQQGQDIVFAGNKNMYYVAEVLLTKNTGGLFSTPQEVMKDYVETFKGVDPNSKASRELSKTIGDNELVNFWIEYSADGKDWVNEFLIGTNGDYFFVLQFVSTSEEREADRTAINTVSDTFYFPEGSGITVADEIPVNEQTVTNEENVIQEETEEEKTDESETKQDTIETNGKAETKEIEQTSQDKVNDAETVDPETAVQDNEEANALECYQEKLQGKDPTAMLSEIEQMRDQMRETNSKGFRLMQLDDECEASYFKCRDAHKAEFDQKGATAFGDEYSELQFEYWNQDFDCQIAEIECTDAKFKKACGLEE